MPPGAGNGARAHLSLKSIVESETGIRESGRDDVARGEEEEYMLRRPTSPPAHVSPAQSKLCERRPTEEWAAALTLGARRARMPRGTCIPVQSAPITRGSKKGQLRLLPRSFAAAWALAGLCLHLVCNQCLPMHGVLRTKPPFTRTASLDGSVCITSQALRMQWS
jgi:hypothetical protein